MQPPASADFEKLAHAVIARQFVRIVYSDQAWNWTQRTVRPLELRPMETAPCLITWCELRGDFREFRIDRIHKIEVMPGTFAVESGKELEDYPPQGPGGKPGVII